MNKAIISVIIPFNKNSGVSFSGVLWTSYFVKNKIDEEIRVKYFTSDFYII